MATLATTMDSLDAPELAQKTILNQMYRELALRSPDGTISREVFGKLFNVPGVLGNRLFSLFDASGDGEIQVEEFIRYYSQFLSCKTVEDRAQFVFDLFDLDDNQRVTKEQLRTILLSLITPPHLNKFSETIPSQSPLPEIKEPDGSVSVESTFELRQTLPAEHPRYEALTAVEFLVKKAFRQRERKNLGYLTRETFLQWIKDNDDIRRLIESYFYQLVWANQQPDDEKIDTMEFLSPSKKELVVNQSILPTTTWKCCVCSAMYYTANEEFKEVTETLQEENPEMNLPGNHIYLSPFQVAVLRFCILCGNELEAIENMDMSLALRDSPVPAPLFYKSGNFLWNEDLSNDVVDGRFVLYNKFIYRYAADSTDNTHPQQVMFISGYSVLCYEQKIGDANLYAVLLNPPRRVGAKRLLMCHIDESVAKDWAMAIEAAAESSLVATFYEFQSVIGKGGFGTIFRGVEKATRNVVAIKQIEKTSMQKSTREFIRVEISILQLVRHPSIPNVINVFESDDYIHIVMELLEGGDLFDYMNNHAPRGMEEGDVREIIFNLVKALQYLHAIGIVHRDLKLENLLIRDVTQPTEICVIDFGLSRFVKPNELMRERCGSLVYVAPELMRLEGYGCEVDLWSTGIIAYVLLCGTFPFNGRTQNEIVHAILNHRPSVENGRWRGISDDAKDFLIRLLCKRPHDRLTVDQALEHPFLAALSSKKMIEKHAKSHSRVMRKKVGRFDLSFSLDQLKTNSVSGLP